MVELSANYNELSAALAEKLAPEFREYGLEVSKLLIENISLPQEVEAALDKKSSMGIIGNLDNYVKFQSANAMEAAAANPGGDAAAGVGMGMGFAMANQLGKTLTEPAQAEPRPQDSPPALPPENSDRYHVAKDGTQTGPFDFNAMQAAIANGGISRATLVWKAGMTNWQAAGQLPELAALLASVPPPLPK